MNIENAAMSKRKGWNNEEIILQMFAKDEIEKASEITKTLSGLTIAEAKSLLERVSFSLEKVVVVPGESPSEVVAERVVDQIKEIREILQEIRSNQIPRKTTYADSGVVLLGLLNEVRAADGLNPLPSLEQMSNEVENG